MLEQITPLWDVYLEHKQQNKSLVLATLVKTTGSSYKKAGAMLLVETNKTTHGLISGGCLEADVAEHAMAVFENGQAQKLTYDLSDESIFGLGAGCDGTIDLVLQLLNGDYLPFSALNPLPDSSRKTTLHIQADESAEFPICSFYLLKENQIIESTVGYHSYAQNSDDELIYQPAPKVAICGAGIDVIPLVKILDLLHWHVTVIDHRPGRLLPELYPQNTQVKPVKITELSTTLEPFDSDAVIIMSHNLDRDAAYMIHFSTTPIAWLGLLGPVKRRDKVLNLASVSLSEIENRLHAPVGLDLGGQMPENIAISIAAQLQQHFYQTKRSK